MGADVLIRGAIVDSWVEPAHPGRPAGPLLVLQLAPPGRSRELTIVEAATHLLPDDGWLEDLGENLCHGSLVAARGRWLNSGFLAATEIDLDR